MNLKDARILIEEIEKNYGKLSDWEKGFLSALKQRLSQGKKPTPGQATVLSNIYSKSVGGGAYQGRQYI